MAKVTGIVSSLSVDDSTGTPQTISDDTTQVTISIPRGQQDVTGLDKVAVERLGLLYDCTVTVTGVADFSATKEHAVFKADPASNATRTVAIGLSNSAATLTLEANLSDYTFTRAQDGSLTYTATLVNANGLQPVWT
jgi:hypothetical protein